MSKVVRPVAMEHEAGSDFHRPVHTQQQETRQVACRRNFHGGAGKMIKVEKTSTIGIATEAESPDTLSVRGLVMTRASDSVQLRKVFLSELECRPFAALHVSCLAVTQFHATNLSGDSLR